MNEVDRLAQIGAPANRLSTEDRDAVEALLRRVSKSSRAWRKRRYLYQAVDHFEGYGDRHSQVWMLLLWWVCEPDVEGYSL